MFTFKEIQEALKAEPKFRITQAIKAVYQQSAESWSEVTVLSKDLRERLNQECPLEIEAEFFRSEEDDTIKAVFDFSGDKVEAVMMRHKERNTVCISSQAGCPLGCAFCMTGTMGAGRNLSVNEIIAQVLFFNRILKDDQERVNNLVFMGMGEPFLNYENVMAAIKKFNDPELFNIGARKISISTAGIIPGILALIKEPWQLNLSFSLHAPNDKLRSELMPINQKYPLEKVLSAIRDYINKTKRRVMIEYVMLRDVNDTQKHAEELAALLKAQLGELFFVNLIPYNPTGKYQPSLRSTINIFKRTLEKNGVDTVERYRFGQDIQAACGQLAAKKQ